MPELPIVGDDGRLLEIAPYIVYATLPFPNDERLRRYHAASLIVKFSGQNGSPDFYGMTEYLLRLLHHAPSAKELNRRAAAEGRRLLNASTALEMMLSLAHHHPEIEITPTRVLHALSKVLRNFPAERSYWRHWTDFKASAHLKIAVEYVAEERGKPLKGHAAVFLFENFLEVLDVAETIRHEAETRRMLRFDEVWRVPAAVQTTRRDLTWKRPSEDLLAAVRSYLPPFSALPPVEGPAN